MPPPPNYRSSYATARHLDALYFEPCHVILNTFQDFLLTYYEQKSVCNCQLLLFFKQGHEIGTIECLHNTFFKYIKRKL